MSTPRIEVHLRKYYEAQDPSPEALARLLALAENPSESGARGGGSASWRWQGLAMAATVTIALIAGLFALFEHRRDVAKQQVAVSTADLSGAIAREVVMRHQTCEQMEFTGSDFALLTANLSKLDFTPVTPDRASLAGLTLLGGHYCMLDGRVALHLMLLDSAGRHVSIMETRATPHLASLTKVTREVGGVSVALWQRDGVIIAIAHPTIA